MVVLSLEEYSKLIDQRELKLDEADHQASTSQERLSHNDVFSKVRKSIINDK